MTGESNAWCDRLRERVAEWVSVDAERARLLRRSAELPNGLIDNNDACEAVSRGAKGQRLWTPLMSLGKGAAKALVGAILLDGAPVREEDVDGWRYVEAVIANTVRQREVRARWDAFAREIGAPQGANARIAIDLAEKILSICDDARSNSGELATILADEFSIDMLANDPALCGAVAKQMRAAATSMQLAVIEQERGRLLQLFQGADRTSALARQLIGDVFGKASVTFGQDGPTLERTS